MNVTVMLAWYDEHPDLLHRAVTSAATIADTVVAVDGRWNLRPGEHHASTRDQYAAILLAAHDTGLECRLPDPPYSAWTSQIHKRNYMLKLAQPTDWLLPLDADWELHGNREAIRAELNTTTADALLVPIHTPGNHTDPHTAATPWHKAQADTTQLEPVLMRNLPGIQVQDFHWHYTGIDNTGKRVSLWGSDQHRRARTRRLKADLSITHWCLHRDQHSIEANRAYCEARDAIVATTGSEPT